jgi:anaerobic selenocysteine-containing dehydrogenase
MGLTQHLMGVQNVHLVANLVLLRGNIGKPCANTCAVRSHSNEPGGFGRPLPARGRKWVTSNKKADFITPGFLFPTFDVETAATDMLHWTTLRSNDQFNTTVYGYGGRFRGVEGTRWVVFMNPIDVERVGLVEGNPIDLITAISDEKPRRISGLRIVAYGIPEGTCATYYPEADPLFPLDHHDDPKAKTPGYEFAKESIAR